MKPKTYAILSRAIEEGVALGYIHAFKHTDDPSEQFVCEKIYEGVMQEICENFTFED